jgi:hypothetical protein
MPKTKVDTALGEKVGNKIQSLVDSTNAADLMIMGMGFFAGWEGGTILDTFFKGNLSSGGSASISLNPFQPSIDRARSDPAVAAIMAGAGYLGFAATFNPFVSAWLQGQVGNQFAIQKTAEQTTTLTPELGDATKAKIAMGCIGAIAAYAFTRPGFLPALMGLAGDIIKEVTSLPIIV